MTFDGFCVHQLSISRFHTLYMACRICTVQFSYVIKKSHSSRFSAHRRDATPSDVFARENNISPITPRNNAKIGPRRRRRTSPIISLSNRVSRGSGCSYTKAFNATRLSCDRRRGVPKHSVLFLGTHGQSSLGNHREGYFWCGRALPRFQRGQSVTHGRVCFSVHGATRTVN